MSKKSYCKTHAKRRALERYGLSLNSKQLKILSKKIQNNEGKFLDRKSNRLTTWLINFENKDYIVGYDKIRHTIITFLPYEDKKKLIDNAS